MDQSENKSKTRLALIIVGVIAVLAILGGAVYALILANQPKPAANEDKKPAVVKPVPTTEEFSKGIDELKQTAETEKTQRAKAQAALDDQLKRTKLSN